MLKLSTTAILTILVFTAAAAAQGTSNTPDSVTLFKNVKVFDGKQDKLQDMDVLVVKNKLKQNKLKKKVLYCLQVHLLLFQKLLKMVSILEESMI